MKQKSQIWKLNAWLNLKYSLYVTKPFVPRMSAALMELNKNPTVVTNKCTDANKATSTDMEHWSADTGATTHMTVQDKFMSNIEQVSVKVIVGDGTEISCTKQGNLRLTDGKGGLFLQHVLYSPKIHKNIVSIGSLICNGHKVKIENRNLIVKDSKMREIIFTCKNESVLYNLMGCCFPYNYVAMSTQTIRGSMEKNKPAKLQALDINLVHDIYCHIGEATLQSTLMAIGIDVTGKLTHVRGVLWQRLKQSLFQNSLR